MNQSYHGFTTLLIAVVCMCFNHLTSAEVFSPAPDELAMRVELISLDPEPPADSEKRIDDGRALPGSSPDSPYILDKHVKLGIRVTLSGSSVDSDTVLISTPKMGVDGEEYPATLLFDATAISDDREAARLSIQQAGSARRLDSITAEVYIEIPVDDSVKNDQAEKYVMRVLQRDIEAGRLTHQQIQEFRDMMPQTVELFAGMCIENRTGDYAVRIRYAPHPKIDAIIYVRVQASEKSCFDQPIFSHD